jgi:hypothetical protein
MEIRMDKETDIEQRRLMDMFPDEIRRYHQLLREAYELRLKLQEQGLFTGQVYEFGERLNTEDLRKSVCISLKVEPALQENCTLDSL